MSALARLDRDILSEPGVRWIVLLEGINDINLHGQITGQDALVAEDLIKGYREIIARAHMHNIKVVGATLTPEEGVWLSGPVGEATRQKLNEWIRTCGDLMPLSISTLQFSTRVIQCAFDRILTPAITSIPTISGMLQWQMPSTWRCLLAELAAALGSPSAVHLHANCGR